MTTALRLPGGRGRGRGHPPGWKAALVLVGLCAVGWLIGIGPSRVDDAAPEQAPPQSSEASVALSRLALLQVRVRASREGYSRKQFGQRWADIDRNGCDTRNDILNRDLDERVWRPGTRDCVVVAGRLRDPYTGASLRFEKSNASAIQIDHVVSLSNAWETGAQDLAPHRRLEFANDPLNLLAVDGPTNDAKGDADAAAWLPNGAFRCDFVARQIEVKVRYGLWTTPAEHEAMRRVLLECTTPPQ